MRHRSGHLVQPALLDGEFTEGLELFATLMSLTVHPRLKVGVLHVLEDFILILEYVRHAQIQIA